MSTERRAGRAEDTVEVVARRTEGADSVVVAALKALAAAGRLLIVGDINAVACPHVGLEDAAVANAQMVSVVVREALEARVLAQDLAVLGE